MIRPSIVLPTMPAGANTEGIEAAAETAERLGWHAAWTTDHLLVPHATEADYGEIFDVLMTLAWVGARHPRLGLGTSVIVVPMRNPVVLAKQIATLDALTGGRVVAGVGVGWNEREFASVGAADRFHVRGAFLDETIRLWRHLWSGTQEPFAGRFVVVRRLHVRAAPGSTRRAPDRDRRTQRRRASTCRASGRRVPFELDVAGAVRGSCRGRFARPLRRPGARSPRSRRG